MEKIFADNGLSPIYFLEIAALYVLTLVFFLDREVYRKHPWFHYSFFGLLLACWLLGLISQTLTSKMYATLMVLSVIVVKVIIRKKRRKLP